VSGSDLYVLGGVMHVTVDAAPVRMAVALSKIRLFALVRHMGALLC